MTDIGRAQLPRRPLPTSRVATAPSPAPSPRTSLSLVFGLRHYGFANTASPSRTSRSRSESVLCKKAAGRQMLSAWQQDRIVSLSSLARMNYEKRQDYCCTRPYAPSSAASDTTQEPTPRSVVGTRARRCRRRERSATRATCSSCLLDRCMTRVPVPYCPRAQDAAYLLVAVPEADAAGNGGAG